MAADTYSRQEILAQELDILDTIHYLNLPFSLQFLHLYSKLTQASSSTECTMAMYILELSLLDSSFTSFKPSLKAWEGSESWNYTDRELKEIEVKFLDCLAQYHNHGQLHQIKKKYSHKQWHKKFNTSFMTSHRKEQGRVGKM